jgi:Zn-finger nucleic acid-binding protein
MSLPAHGHGQLGELRCPRCDARLQARKYADLEVDECDACGGLFISPKMLDSIVANRDTPTGLQLALPKRAVYQESAVNYLKCPSCRNTMNRKMFGRISGVIVDVCRDHGVWFDSGELSEVLGWIQRGGLELARQRELQELSDQARSLRNQQLAASSSRAVLSEASPASLRGLGLSPAFGTEIVAAFVELWRDLR